MLSIKKTRLGGGMVISGLCVEQSQEQYLSRITAPLQGSRDKTPGGNDKKHQTICPEDRNPKNFVRIHAVCRTAKKRAKKIATSNTKCGIKYAIRKQDPAD